MFEHFCQVKSTNQFDVRYLRNRYTDWGGIFDRCQPNLSQQSHQLWQLSIKWNSIKKNNF